MNAFPSILVWRDPWFRKIAWSFSHAMYVFTVVKKTACLHLLRLVPSTINSFLIMEFNFPDVVDVLGKSSRKQYIVLQCRIKSIVS